jgi:hypothetical protein
MKKNRFRFGFAILLFGMMAIFMLASCKQAKVVEKPIETVSAQTNVEQKTPLAPGPHPEAAMGVPEVSKQNENILLVYRHTGSGYAEAYGFDTYIFRLLADGSGQITGGIAYQRTIGGELEAVRYNTSLSGDEMSLTTSVPGQKSWTDTLKVKENRIDVSGAHKMTVILDKALAFSSSDGSYRESYSVDPAQKDLPAEIKKGNSVMEKGAWSYPESGKAVYVQTKPEDTQNAEGFQISLWYQDKGDFRFATEGPEPVNEVYAAGLASVLAGDHALVNVVLLDLMLGESRYMRPVYAFGISRRGTGK